VRRYRKGGPSDYRNRNEERESAAGKIIRFRAEAVPLPNRITQGVKLIGLEGEERLVGLARAERDGGGRGEPEEEAPDNGG